MNLSDNQLCGLDSIGRGTYTAEGITAISDALRINSGLTKLDIRGNSLSDEAKDIVRKAVEGREGFVLEL